MALSQTILVIFFEINLDRIEKVSTFDDGFESTWTK